jgi:hypothetical protein
LHVDKIEAQLVLLDDAVNAAVVSDFLLHFVRDLQMPADDHIERVAIKDPKQKRSSWRQPFSQYPPSGTV